jgi:hypothetical protein
MADGKMVRARKDYRCSFCDRRIHSGHRYWFERITPWDHYDNESYSVLRAHHRCIRHWNRVGDVYDWYFPIDPWEWRRDMVESWLMRKRSHQMTTGKGVS